MGIAVSDGVWGDTFRILYVPPPPEKCSGLENSGLIWHGTLESRNFNGSGQVD
jgi:hypothetical protein